MELTFLNKHTISPPFTNILLGFYYNKNVIDLIGIPEYVRIMFLKKKILNF